MADQLPFHREDPAEQRDLKTLRQREQQVLEKLAEAREVQSRALKRLAQAQARVTQLETRLRAAREHLNASRSTHSQQPAPAAKTPATRQPETDGPAPTGEAAEEMKVEAPVAKEMASSTPDMTESTLDAQVNNAEAQDTSATDTTAKIPAIRQSNRSQEQS